MRAPAYARQAITRAEHPSRGINHHAQASLGQAATLNARLRLSRVSWATSANHITQQELRAELNLFQEACMRTLLLGALVANLAGCSHQLPPAQMAANSCASTNQLACFMAVGVSLRPTSRASAKLESKPAVPRKTNAAAVSVSTAKQGSAEAAIVEAKARDRRLAAAR
jgi:Tfp pilus assembly protein PilV